MTALLNYSLCSQSLQSHGEAATSRRKKKNNIIKPSLSRCRNKPGVFMRAVSHSVFVVEAVAWVGPWGQDEFFPVGLLWLEFRWSVPWQRLRATCGFEALGRPSRGYFGSRWARWEAFVHTWLPEVQNCAQLERDILKVSYNLISDCFPPCTYRGGRDGIGIALKGSWKKNQGKRCEAQLAEAQQQAAGLGGKSFIRRCTLMRFKAFLWSKSYLEGQGGLQAFFVVHWVV